MIREICESDLMEIISLDNETIQSNWSYDHYLNELKNDSSLTWLYTLNDEVRAFIIINIMNDESEIFKIAVKETYQNQGIGKHLIENTLNYLKNRKVRTIYLEVKHTNKKAISFYNQYGFETIYVRENYYNNNVKANVMRKRF